MHQENIHSAKTNLSRLVALALEGKQVVIAKDGKPAVRLVPFQDDAEAVRKKRKQAFGCMKGKITPSKAWDFKKLDKAAQDLFLKSKRLDK